MMKMSSRLYVGCVVAVLGGLNLSGCGKKSDKGDQIEQQKDDKIDEQMPLANALNLIEAKDVPAGNWGLTEIVSLFSGTSDKVSGRFDHKLKTIGDIQNGDKVEQTADWGTLNKDKTKLYLTHEINLSEKFQSKDGKLAFVAKKYYWNQIKSNGGWSWSLSGEESTEGAKFHQLILTGTYANGLYTDPSKKLKLYEDEKSSASAIKKISDTKIYVYFTILHENETRVTRLTYEKNDSVKIDDSSFVHPEENLPVIPTNNDIIVELNRSNLTISREVTIRDLGSDFSAGRVTIQDGKIISTLDQESGAFDSSKVWCNVLFSTEKLPKMEEPNAVAFNPNVGPLQIHAASGGPGSISIEVNHPVIKELFCSRTLIRVNNTVAKPLSLEELNQTLNGFFKIQKH